MKRKTIEFDAEALLGSVEALAAHVRGERKLTLRTHAVTLPEPIQPIQPEEVSAIRRRKGEDSGAVDGRDAGDGSLDCGAIADGQRAQCEHAAVSLAVG